MSGNFYVCNGYQNVPIFDAGKNSTQVINAIDPNSFFIELIHTFAYLKLHFDKVNLTKCLSSYSGLATFSPGIVLISVAS